MKQLTLQKSKFYHRLHCRRIRATSINLTTKAISINWQARDSNLISWKGIWHRIHLRDVSHFKTALGVTSHK